MNTISKVTLISALTSSALFGANPTFTKTLQDNLYIVDYEYVYTVVPKELITVQKKSATSASSNSLELTNQVQTPAGANSLAAQENTPNNDATKEEESTCPNLFHMLGLNVGVASTSFDTDAVKDPEKKFDSVELFTTLNCVCKRDDVKPYISLTSSDNDDLKHQYILVGLNKYYEMENSNLYAGLLLGYGELEWKEETTSEDTATSGMGGLQVGMNYGLSDNLYLNLNLKGLVHDYSTMVQDPNNGGQKEIEHDITTSAMIGLAYKF